jgi:hypothetical protein
MLADIRGKNIVIKPIIERERITDKWLLSRLQNLLPPLMKKHEMEMWITIGREYNEDPISTTLFPSAINSSRRLTVFVFVKELEKDHVNRYVISSNKEFEPYYTCYPCKSGDSPFHAIREIMDTYHPKKIAINKSAHFAFCDGLSETYYETLIDTIGIPHTDKLISSEMLAADWLQLRTVSEIEMYQELVMITKSIVKSALSNEVIVPNETTTKNVVHWIRQKVMDLGLQTSFYPTVDIQRKDASADRVIGTILHGDIIHIDFGIQYLGLCTDTQQLAYVLHPYEKEVPQGLQHALVIGNQFEDLFFESCRLGMTGNQIFNEVIKKAESIGIFAMLYSHPIGYHCHGAGPIIGLYDKQEDIPVRGELSIQNNTCYAMEFNIRCYIPEWNQEIPIYLEETVCFKEEKMVYLAGRQTKFHIITS